MNTSRYYARHTGNAVVTSVTSRERDRVSRPPSRVPSLHSVNLPLLLLLLAYTNVLD